MLQQFEENKRKIFEIMKTGYAGKSEKSSGFMHSTRNFTQRVQLPQERD